MQQSQGKERDETQSCERLECALFDARRYLRKLRELLPYVPPVDLAELERLHRARDHKAIVQIVKRLMNIEEITFKVFWVPDGAAQNANLRDAPAWVKIPSEMPLYGSKEFRKMTIEIFFRKSFFEQSYDRAILAAAHELSHVVLESIRHPLRRCEKAVDMTVMLLGFSRLYELACQKEQRIGNTLNIQTLGYLSRDEARLVNEILAEKPAHHRKPKISISDSIARTKLPAVIIAGAMSLIAVPSLYMTLFTPSRSGDGSATSVASSRQTAAMPQSGASSVSAGVQQEYTSSTTQPQREAPPNPISATQSMPEPFNATAIKAIQSRLRSLGYASPVTGVWDSPTRDALFDFKIANHLNPSDELDLPTQQRLKSTSSIPVTQSFIGDWSTSDCQLLGNQVAPISLNSHRAKSSSGVTCEFLKIAYSRPSWRIQALCQAGEQRWSANISLTLKGNELIWASERGIDHYFRCK
jgi:hypothetical protein